MDEWLETKLVSPDAQACKALKGHAGIEAIDEANGDYRIWAAHECPDKKMTFRIKWP